MGLLSPWAHTMITVSFSFSPSNSSLPLVLSNHYIAGWHAQFPVVLSLELWKLEKKDQKEAMLRASHIPPVATPALSALKISLIPALSLSSSLPHLYKLSTFAPLHNFLPKTAPPNPSPISFKRFLPMLGHHPCPKGTSGQFYQKP